VTDAGAARARSHRALLVPPEHGAWSWLLVPWLAGAAVGLAGEPTAPRAGLAVGLTLVAALAAFLARQPATVWLHARQGRGRPADRGPALRWALALGLVALLALLLLLALGRTALASLVVPLAVVLLAYLLAARRGRAATRSLWMELSGAVGLALAAPAAIVAASGHMAPAAWALWALLALQNATGVLYVRTRLADTKGRPARRASSAAAHAAALAAVVLAGARGWVPALAVVPFGAYLARALWAARRPRPVADVKRFGLREVGVEIAGGALLAAGFL